MNGNFNLNHMECCIMKLVLTGVLFQAFMKILSIENDCKNNILPHEKVLNLYVNIC